MSGLTRISVSLEEDLLEQFDRLVAEDGYPTRSEAVKTLIRNTLIKKEWSRGGEVAGAITMVYDHHRINLVNQLLDVQHDFGSVVLASQHIHLDHDHCLEILVVKGEVSRVRSLTSRLKSVKGIKHCELAMTTTGGKLA